MEPVRVPAVAGRFYPDEPQALTLLVQGLLRAADAQHPVDARVILAPHAGYVYSGAIAGATYASVRVPDTVVILCPNHTGLGVERSVYTRGKWRIPGVEIPVAARLADALAESAHLTPDTLAHVREHAVEVHLPFLHARNPDVSIVPVVLSPMTLSECRDVGRGLARGILECRSGENDDVLIVASSDMSHYVTAEQASRLDRLALERVAALDPEGLHVVVRQHEISMCGYVPTTVALIAARELGATRANLVRYGNSGETSGDFEQVVGYAGAVVW